MKKLIMLIYCLGLFTISCKPSEGTAQIRWDTLRVTATAYNSLPEQTTKDNPAIAAWGDELKPGMKVIAVSRDLIDKGIGYNTQVKIKGFEGTFLVKDKMNPRWTNKIDIYMGEDVKKALNWGRREVTIYIKREE